MYLNDIYTIGANLAGLAGTVGALRFRRRLPMGLQLIGPHFSEGEAAECGASISNGHRLAPSLAAAGTSNERLGSGHWPGDPRAARDEVEDILRIGDRLRRASEYPGQPGRSGISRRAAGVERRRRAHGGQVRPEHRRRGGAPFGVRAQELLLSGFAEGLSDQSVRAAGGQAGPAANHARRRRPSRPSASPARISRRTRASLCTRDWRTPAASI